MNILFLGPYRSSSGWGKAAQEYLQSLLLTGHNVCCRPVYMCNAIEEHVSNKILDAEKNQFDNPPDVIIQNVLPDLLEWYKGYNIGIFDTETWDLTNNVWIDKINLMDEVWVDSEAEGENLHNSGVTCKINPIPVPVNIELLKQYEDVEPLDIAELKDKFVFYFIGEHTDRKNIMAFVKAFHREFEPEENVGIFIKTSSEKLQTEINEFKKFSRTRRNYIPDVLISQHIPEKQIYAIHKTCHCLVVTSRGESQCRPILDALYFNNEVICTSGIFAEEMFNDEFPYPLVYGVDSHLTPVYTKEPPLPHIYTGKELWNEIDIIDLQKMMRSCFMNRDKERKPTEEIVKEYFSREAISERMKRCLSLVT